MHEPTHATLARSLRHALPEGVAVVGADIGLPLPPLLGAERSATTNMSPQRLLEFTAGRACARAALQELGITQSAGLPVGAHREPLWPAGTVGSISHSRHVAIAAVCRTPVLRAIGLDIEAAVPLEAELMSRVCRPEELSRLADHADPALKAKAVFSAKEAAYKCLWPVTGLFLEFSDVEIVLDPAGDGFRVIGWGPLRDYPCGAVGGRVFPAAGHFVAVAYIGTGSGVARPVDDGLNADL